MEAEKCDIPGLRRRISVNRRQVLRPSSEKQHLGESGGSLRRAPGALPTTQHARSSADLASRWLLAPRKTVGGGQHAPPRESRPSAQSGFGVRRAARQLWRAAGPAQQRCAPASPQARPGPPGLREPSPRLAPALTAHARPPPSPGAGAPAAAACPQAERDEATGSRAPAGRTGQWRTRRTGGGAPPIQPLVTRPEPKESLAERGVAPRGRRGRIPALPLASERSHRRAPPTGEARIRAPGRSRGCWPVWNWSPRGWQARSRRWHPLKDREHPRGSQSHT